MIRAVLHDTQGATAILTALTLATVMGFVALGIESATGLHEQRALQDAADAAALAAVLGIRAGSVESPAALANAVLAQHGVTPQSGHTITTRATSRSRIDSPVEVRIERQRLPRFAGLLGDTGGSISAHAVAGLVPEAQGCLLGLAESSAIQIDRPSDLQLDGCSALSTGHGLSRIRTAEADPYRDVVLPAAAGCQASNTIIRNSVTASSGIRPFAFCGGLTVAAGGRLHLQSGTYTISGGALTVQPGGTLTGSNVTILLAGGASVQVQPGATIDLSAPRSGQLAGLAIAGSGSGQAALLGGGSQRIVGTVHLPARTLAYAGSAESPCTQLVASRILISGETHLESSCAGTGARPMIDRIARLMQ